MASAASSIGGAAALSAPAGANAGPVLTASAAASGQAAQAAANATMNNGRKDTTHSDVQKLQQQLNDIKEQVWFTYIVFFSKNSLSKLQFSISKRNLVLMV